MEGNASITIYIQLFIVLTMLVGITPPLQAAIQDVINTDANLQASIISSTINMLRAAPDGTRVIISLQDTDCKAIIENSILIYNMKVSGNEKTVIDDIIQNPTEIVHIEARCPQKLTLKKENGRIVVA